MKTIKFYVGSTKYIATCPVTSKATEGFIVLNLKSTFMAGLTELSIQNMNALEIDNEGCHFYVPLSDITGIYDFNSSGCSMNEE